MEWYYQITLLSIILGISKETKIFWELKGHATSLIQFVCVYIFFLSLVFKFYSLVFQFSIL